MCNEKSNACNYHTPRKMSCYLIRFDLRVEHLVYVIYFYSCST